MIERGTAIPTSFNGVKLRSRLEANVAFFLTKIGIKWEYETKSFLLPSGHYCPDFYFPEIEVFCEVKGVRTELSDKLCQELGNTTNFPVLCLAPKRTSFIYGCFYSDSGCGWGQDEPYIFVRNKKIFFCAGTTGADREIQYGKNLIYPTGQVAPLNSIDFGSYQDVFDSARIMKHFVETVEKV